jgi:hypothetical protein
MRSYFLASRVLPDGRELGVVPLTYGRARIVWSRSVGALFYEDAW